MRLTRRSFLGAAAAMAGAACAAPVAPAPAVSPAAARRVERLVLSWWTDTGYPSPFTFSAIGPGGVVKVMLMFDTLTWKDERGIVPWLAERWAVEDGGTSYVFRLRPGVTFHDGRPLAARDVAFTFDYFARFPSKWASTAVVASAEATDDRTVRVRLHRPFAPFLEDIAGAVPILPEHVWSNVSDPLKFLEPRAVVGSGPYELVSYAEGRGEYLFRARRSHFAGTPLVRELAYVLVPLAQSVIALQTRAVDALQHFRNYDVVAAFGGGDPYRILTTQPFSIMRLIFNVDRQPFTDRRVRHAVAYALNRRDIAERVTRAPDVVVGSAGVIPPESPWHAKVKEYPFDPQRARRLLDEAGVVDRDGDGLRELPDGAKLTVELLADPAADDAQLVMAQLRAVGLASRLLVADPKTRTELQQKRAFQLALTSHIGVGGDPDFLRRWFAGEVFNVFEFGNALHSPEFDALAAAQSRELDLAKRKELVARMQQVLAEELPTLPLYHRRAYHVYDPAKWDRWFNTAGGIMTGIPLLENKLAFLGR